MITDIILCHTCGCFFCKQGEHRRGSAIWNNTIFHGINLCLVFSTSFLWMASYRRWPIYIESIFMSFFLISRDTSLVWAFWEAWIFHIMCVFHLEYFSIHLPHFYLDKFEFNTRLSIMIVAHIFLSRVVMPLDHLGKCIIWDKVYAKLAWFCVVAVYMCNNDML